MGEPNKLKEKYEFHKGGKALAKAEEKRSTTISIMPFKFCTNTKKRRKKKRLLKVLVERKTP